MRFYEFEAKKLLAKSGVRLPAGGTAETASEAQRLAAEIGGPVVLKSQVLSGGRMKAGGVKFATDRRRRRRRLRRSSTCRSATSCRAASRSRRRRS